MPKRIRTFSNIADNVLDNIILERKEIYHMRKEISNIIKDSLIYYHELRRVKYQERYITYLNIMNE